MQHGVPTRRTDQTWPWFAWAGALVLLFGLYTALLINGVLNASTVQIEQWLVQRPVTRLDCTFYEWRNLGTASFMAVLLIIVGLLCVRLGYRWHVLPCLLIVFLVGIGGEVAGKALLTQPIPQPVSSGLSLLNCPQLHVQPASVRLSAATGLWWNVPPAPEWLSLRLERLAHLPLTVGGVYEATSYPGGHALRWSFLGVLMGWLCQRHIQRLSLRIPLQMLALVATLGGGFMQFYIGAHLITDTIAGYLLGMAAACCAISILLLFEKPKEVVERAPRIRETA